MSFALGAFFAGVLLSESDLSHQAAADSLPLQDAFAVLFFVSVGMLFDPTIVVRDPLAVLAVLAAIVVGKSIAAFLIVLVFRYPVATALTVSASLAQIGEFSFILAAMGVSLGLLPPEGRDLILAGALISITLNPFVFATITPVTRWVRARPALLAMVERGAARLAVLPENQRSKAVARSRGDRRIWPRGQHDRSGAGGSAACRSWSSSATCGWWRCFASAAFARSTGMRRRVVCSKRPVSTTAKLLVIASPDSYAARRVLDLARRANPQHR